MQWGSARVLYDAPLLLQHQRRWKSWRLAQQKRSMEQSIISQECVESRHAAYAGSAEWNGMVEDMVVSCAGLVQYLADQWPPELQEGWLQY